MVGYIRLLRCALVHLFILSTVSSILVAIEPTGSSIDPNWCGNKHANLVRLQGIVQGERSVQVPEFVGISTSRVEAFLRKYTDVSLFTEYTRAIHLVNADMINQAGPILENIQKRVKDCFTHPAHLFDFTNQEQLLFQNVAHNNQFFMVRSTGIEDSQTVANAGGNASIAYVAPTQKAIQEAMGEVVASYFGIQSLKNRKAGGETLSDDLCVPVLIQLLIGEVRGGAHAVQDIPVSGVAFTTNQSLSEADFRVTEINAAYGHGEGVVANRVVADRYYAVPSLVDHSIMLYPTIYYKRERLVPNMNGALIAIPNDAALAERTALSADTIQALYRVLKNIEAAYGQPMDVEFVSKGSTLYIVQARPAMRHPMSPSYVDVEKAVAAYSACSFIQGITIVPGDAHVRVITDPADLIVANTLDDADQMANSATARVVLVAQWASSLSHAAVNFMSHGIPCLYIPQIHDIKKIVQEISSDNPLVVDVQRRVLFHWKCQTPISSYILSGWFEHPAERSLSLFVPGLVKPALNPQPRDGQLVGLMETFKKSSSAQEQANILASIVQRVTARLALTKRRMNRAQGICDAAFQTAFAEFESTFEIIRAQLQEGIAQGAPRLALLFYHKMLEALLYQSGLDHKVGAYTYDYFLNKLVEQQGLFLAFQKLGNLKLAKEFTYASYCSTAPMKEQWRELLIALEQCGKNPDQTYQAELEKFTRMLADFAELDGLALWFATEFHQAMAKQSMTTLRAPDKLKYARSLLTQMTAQYTNNVHAFVRSLKQYKNDIKTFQAHNTVPFTQVQAAQAFWEQIKTRLIVPLTDPYFVTALNRQSRSIVSRLIHPPVQLPFVIKVMACDVMTCGVEVLDTTIKTVKASSSLSLQERIALFKQMLGDFNTLCTTWLQDIMPAQAIEYHVDWDRATYIARVQERYQNIMSASTTASMFQRSSSFAVDAAVLGSGTAFNRHYPQTAEDMFMLIHQNSLVAVSGTLGQLFQGQKLHELLYIPPLMQDVIAYLESPACYQLLNIPVWGWGGNGFEQLHPRRIGIVYKDNAITLRYNVPLRNHSSTFEIGYNTITNECTFTAYFLGEARNRWEQIAILAVLTPHLSGIPLASDVLLDTQGGIVSCSWVIKQKEAVPSVIEYFAVMARFSFQSYGIEDYIDSLLQSSKSMIPAIQTGIQQYKRMYGSNYFTDRVEQKIAPQQA